MAGFLFVTLFIQNEGWSLPLAFGVALGLTIIMHFIGSCLQYYVGKMRFVQIWANRVLPPQMLAASDSVLKNASLVFFFFFCFFFVFFLFVFFLSMCAVLKDTA